MQVMKLEVPQTSQSIINLDCMTARSRSICRSTYAAQKKGSYAASSSEGMTAWLLFKEYISILADRDAFNEFATSHELGPNSFEPKNSLMTRHSQ